ncbi:MAG: hypothetical protein HLUCCO18_08380 [Rhodobacteraceae bacterium HLUCCO18]|nr:MAG: hypothetical protein HLUCCO18_08380 [Rhodobacteraceae bacterium HLUCCO18]
MTSVTHNRSNPKSRMTPFARVHVCARRGSYGKQGYIRYNGYAAGELVP